jgi:hypothetical protein
MYGKERAATGANLDGPDGGSNDERQAKPNGSTTQEATRFLQALRPGGPWLLTWIHPDDGTITTMELHDVEEACRLVETWNGERNQYFSVNRTRKGLESKASKDDVTVIEYLHADLDPEDHETPEQAKERYLALLVGDWRPSILIDSGNGLQSLFRLAEPITLTEDKETRTAQIADVERRIAGLLDRFDSKRGTQDISRVLRVPATINLPNAAKRKRGRGPCHASLLWAEATTFKLIHFPLAEEKPKRKRILRDPNALDLETLPKHLRILLVTGSLPYLDRNDWTRSEWVLYAICELIRTGVADDDIIDIMVDPRLAISDHIRDQAGDPRHTAERQLQRALDMHQARPRNVLFDFYAPMTMGERFIHTPSGDAWPLANIDAAIEMPIPMVDDAGNLLLTKQGQPQYILPRTWLRRHRAVEQVTWAPGLPLIIRDRLICDGGWIPRDQAQLLNLYRPPTLEPGDAAQAGPWLDHVRLVFPDDAEHIFNWLAHRVKHPEEKLNHALVLGGKPGIGKDTILEPVKHAVGPWNFQERSPKQCMERFNKHLRSVVLRISEVRDLGEKHTRFEFYEHMKPVIAAPPDVLPIDEKNWPVFYVPNLTAVIMTTNHHIDGIFLPADDRRHYMAWSMLTQDDFDEAYWKNLWAYYQAGGIGHVAAFLAKRDLTDFDAKAPPLKTQWFWDVVAASTNPEESELDDVLDHLGEKPDPRDPSATIIERRPAITIHDLIGKAYGAEIEEWLKDRKNRRAIPHRLEQCGYVPIRNGAAKDGLWKIRGERQVIYVLASLTPAEQLKAARALAGMKPSEDPF